MDNTYEQGLQDGWAIAKEVVDYWRVNHSNSFYEAFDLTEAAKQAYSFLDIFRLIFDKDPLKVKEMLKEANAIKVGDEVQYNNIVGVVTRVQDFDEKKMKKLYHILRKDGCIWTLDDSIAQKTGRHFSQIAEIVGE